MSFLLNNFRLLAFGFWMAVFSSFGQTYFIGIYRETISAEFHLSNSDFGLYYMFVTIGSAVGLNQLGHLIDRVPLRPYAAALLSFLAVSCLLMGLSGPVLTVFGAMVFVRLMGQGMMVHAAMTSMSRYFDRNRGQAVAIAGLGMPVGQALLPPLAVWLLTGMEWRASWYVFALLCVAVGAPVALWLLNTHATRHDSWLAQQTADHKAAGDTGQKVWRRGDVVKDIRFYLMLPALIVTPFWITAVFFFAEDIASVKGWTMQGFTGLYWLYALGAATTPLVGGVLVDKLGGTRLLPAYPPVMALGLWLAISSESGMGVGAFLALMGLALGAAGPINNAMWAELYGTRFLGEIKALATSLMVLSTALAPYLLGLLLDAGVAFSALLMAGIGHCLFSAILVLPVARSKLVR